MGFYYLLILLVGIVLLAGGSIKWAVSRSFKRGLYLLVFGMVLIAASLFLLTPDSSEIIYNLIH